MADDRHPTNPYLQPWSVINDDRLKLLLELESLCEPCRHREPDEVLYMKSVSTSPLETGRIGQVLKALKDLRNQR